MEIEENDEENEFPLDEDEDNDIIGISIIISLMCRWSFYLFQKKKQNQRKTEGTQKLFQIQSINKKWFEFSRFEIIMYIKIKHCQNLL